MLELLRKVRNTVSRTVCPSGFYKRKLQQAAHAEWLSGEPELHLLPYICAPDRGALDVGANIGIYSHYFLKYSAFCCAFEPNRKLVIRLKAAFGDSLDIYPFGVSNQTGIAELQTPLVGGIELDGLSTIAAADRLNDVPTIDIQIETRRLDDLPLQPIGVIKIDVEGHELAVLEGASALLDRDSPNILVEAEERHMKGTIKACASFLHNKGYRGFFLDEGQLFSVDGFSTERHQNIQNVDFGGKKIRKKYINNFLFLHNDIVNKYLLSGFFERNYAN